MRDRVPPFRPQFIPICVAAAALLAAVPARGGGFQHYEHSALATGMANARTALWDDASALYYSPAAITELEGVHLSIGDTVMTGTADYTPLPEEERTSPTDGEHPATTERRALPPFHLYLTGKTTRWLTLGIGVTNQFGAATYWPEHWDGRFTAWQMDIKTFYFQPTAAVDIARLAGLPRDIALGVALGVDYVYATVVNKTKVDLSNLGPGAEADLKVEGDAHGAGVNYALFAAWKPWVSLGVSVRSEVNLAFEGTASFTGIDPQVDELLHTIGIVLPASTGHRSPLRLPWNLNVGVGFHGLPRFTFALDLYVSFWESYDELRVEFDCAREGTCFSGLNEIAVKPKKWGTAYKVAFGVEYRPIAPVAVRIGYSHSRTPVNPEYFDAVIPDGNRNIFSVGLGYRAPRVFKVDVAYLFAFWSTEKRNEVGEPSTTGPGGYGNGSFDIKAHVVSISLGFSFAGPKKAR